MKLTIALIALALPCTRMLFPQQAGINNPATDTTSYTMAMQSNLVVEAVTVKNKQGQFMYGLTAKDFILSEDGKPQVIRYCEYQNLSDASKPLPPLTVDQNSSTIYKQLSRTRLMPDTEVNPHYNNRRLLVLYFDTSALGYVERTRALEAAMKFIRTQLTSADMVAIMRYNGGSVDVLEDFTAERNRLLNILQTLAVGEDSEFAADSSSSDKEADTAFGQNDAEFNLFNTDRELAALQTAVQMLGHVSEKKSLIYFTSGLPMTGIDNQAQMHATTDAAIRAGVSIWTIDARGLVASAPLGDVSQASSGGRSMYTGEAATDFDLGFSRSQESLYTLAVDTGGKAFLDNNDLSRGIVEAQQAISNYYILSYYTTNVDLNGQFRRIRISVVNNQDAKLDYRIGYYAGKEFRKFNDADRERQLEEALMLEAPITDLTVAMEIDYFQMNRAEYFVPIVVKIPGREVALAKSRGANFTHVDFIGEIKDLIGGDTVTNLRDDVTIRLSDATAAELAHRPLEYDTGFTLLPGEYSIKFLVRDDETGRIGTFQTNFSIPNLVRIKDSVPISAVVLSSQRVDLKDAIYDAEKAKSRAREEGSNPLVQGTKKIIPSVTRVFTTGHKISVFFEAYKEKSSKEETDEAAVSKPIATNAAPPSLYAFATLYQNGRTVYESKPKEITEPTGNSFSALPFSFEIDNGPLPRGRYELQITVIDPAKKQFSTWRAQVILAE